MSEFLHMGGHGIYIWPGYALTLILLVYHYFAPMRKTKKLKKDLIAYYQSRNLR